MSHEPARDDTPEPPDDDRLDAEMDSELDDLDDIPRPPPSPPPVCPSLIYGHEIGVSGFEPVEWLWEPYLAFGALSVLDGDPEVGKSLLTIDIAARLGTRRAFPDGRPAPANPADPKGVVPTIFVNAEDAVRQTILPRIAAAMGNPDCTIFLGGVGEVGRAMQFPLDLPRFARILREFPGSFVVLDPMMALISRSAAAGSDQAIREVLTPLARLAASTRCCVLLVRHLSTRMARRALHRGAGSVGIVGACRTALVVERHPDDPDRRVLAMTKTNLGPTASSLGFRVVVKPETVVERVYRAGGKDPDTGEVLKEPKSVHLLHPSGPVIEWEVVSPLTADDLCHARPDAAGPGLRAAAWLRKVLANGPVAATEIETLADKEGFGYRTVQIAKRRLNVESLRAVSDGQARWLWTLPPDPSE